MSNTPNGQRPPLRSTLSGDPEMLELVEMFVADLSRRREAIRAAMEGRRADDLKRLAHQLRGASASYGLKPLGDAAGRVEDAIKRLEGRDAAELERVRAEVDELIEMCDRAAGG
ncbi:MAG: hypothetical protein GC200_03345 [Tepidisphaera sp.]|nr:hypothetical protein [Tepidisphaera sp.]